MLYKLSFLILLASVSQIDWAVAMEGTLQGKSQTLMMEEEQKDNQIENSLDRQLDNVLAYSKTKDHLNLALGVSVAENDLRERFDDSWVFSNMHHGIPTPVEIPGRTITWRFEDLEGLTKMANKLECVFDQIVIDDMTYWEAKWSVEHVEQLLRLLKPNGTFVFNPYPNQSGVIPELNGKDFNDVVQYNEKMAQEETENGMLVKYQRTTLFPVPIREGAYEQEITTIIDLYKSAEDYLPIILPDPFDDEEEYEKVEDETNDQLNKAGIKLPYGILEKEFVQNDNEFKKFVVEQVNQSKFTSFVWENCIFPLNIRPIFLLAGFKTVEANPNGTLPFKSHYFDKERLIITAIKG